MKFAFIVMGLATLALATAATASAVYDFRTPSYTYCYTTEGEVTYTPNPAMVCFLTPYGPGRRALVYRMSPRGKVSIRHDDSLTFFQGYARVLRLGQSWWALDTGDNVSSGFGIPRHGWTYRCTGTRTYLHCVNRAGHGWWLPNIRGYRAKVF
jgi:hypothetical protein